jgi:hypothetical protein
MAEKSYPMPMYFHRGQYGASLALEVPMRTMNVTYRGQTYSLQSEAAIIALCLWLAVQEHDARLAA